MSQDKIPTGANIAIDPICGMEVDEESALRAELDGTAFYLCSEH